MIAFETTFTPSSETGTLTCGCGCSIYWEDCDNGFIDMVSWRYCPECGRLKMVEIDENTAARKILTFILNNQEWREHFNNATEYKPDWENTEFYYSRGGRVIIDDKEFYKLCEIAFKLWQEFRQSQNDDDEENTFDDVQLKVSGSLKTGWQIMKMEHK